MSTTSLRWPHAKAMNLAVKIVEQLAPHCQRIEIAGSLRRNKETVGDIELLYIPKMGQRPNPRNLFAEPVEYSLADDLIEEWLTVGRITKRLSSAGKTIWGGENKLAIHVASGFALDFYSTCEANWWNALVMRTGGRDNNMKLTTGALSMKPPRSWNVYGKGVTCDDGSVIQATSEEHVFELCGVPYRKPEDRT